MMLSVSMYTFAQNKHVIKGVVTDTKQEPLIGATVMVKGNSSLVTVTDINGQFTLSVPDQNQTLVISYIGMTQQLVPITPKSQNLKIELSEDKLQLDEVVVVGYGTMKKSDVTGSVAKIGSADLKNLSTSDAAVALQGKAAGVQVLLNSGAPGKGADIRVRGMSSNSANNGPLLIVDGLKVDNIQYLDPEMIESMEILKDAASAAIYGAQAGNGVVLITTKSGSKSKNGTVFYNAQWQNKSLARKLDVMNADQYIAYGKEVGFITDAVLKNSGYVPGTDVNWANEVFTPTWTSRHTLGFQGGNDSGSYFVAINNVNENGIFKGDKDVYKRLSLQTNGEYKIKPWLTVGVNNSIEKWSTKSVSQQSDNGSALLAAVTSDPLFGPLVTDPATQLTVAQKTAIANGVAVLKNEDGLYYRVSPISGESQSSNPFIQRDRTDGSSDGINIRGLAYLNFNPIKGLVYTSRFGYRISQGNSHSYSAPFVANDFVKSSVYNIQANANTSYYYQFENFINYNKTIADKHEVGAMAGMSWEANHSDNVSVTSEGADILKGYDPNFRYINYLLANAQKTVGNAPGDSKNMSYFGRLTYTFDKRYSIQGNFRADAFDASKLPKAARWGYFPSVSAGWTLSNESFIKDNISEKILSSLKLRAGWGRNGNISVLNGYPYATIINKNSNWYQYDQTGAQTYGSVTNGLPNPDLTWETSEQIDLGLEGRMFNGRLSFELGYYKKETKGLLVTVTPVVETGVGSTVKNAGNVDNKGFELVLGWKDKIGDLTYSVNANMSTLNNKLTYLDPSIKQINGTTLQGSSIVTECKVGEPLWYFKGYKFDKFDANGLATFKDVNGDGKWDSNDVTNIGSGLPTFNYGITINLGYKGFDLLVFGTGAAGFDIIPQAWRVDRKYCNNYSWYYENSWTPQNTNAKFPAVKNWTKDAYSSDLAVFKGDYFKIKQIQLGYTIPSKITKKFFISNLRVFGSLDNFFTFTKYFGLDPETASANNSSSLGIDMGTYPTAKQATFGVNLSF
ncbi:SusC/RagA family TonB-linked outer membrane protein [Paludibacter propionicigenes]|nr:TonB-dependent receptor [Paludibacter propionicigenes]